MKTYFFNLIFAFFLGTMCSQNVVKNKSIKNLYTSGLAFLEVKKHEKGLELITLGLEESQKIKDKSLIGYGYFYTAVYHQKKKTYLQGIEFSKKALAIFKGLKKEKEIYNCSFKLGLLHHDISEFDTALENYFVGLEIAERNHNQKQIARTLEQIGAVYLLTPDLEKAKIYFNKALAMYQETNDEFNIVVSYSNLGAVIQKQGKRSNNKDLIREAIETFKEGLIRAEKSDFQGEVSIFLGNIGSSYRSLQKYEESLSYLFKALTLRLEMKEYRNAAHTCNDISETYLAVNDLINARKYAVKAVSYSKGISIYQERFGYYLLSKIDYELGDFKKSHNFLKRYHGIQDSMFSVQKITKINDLQIKYETEKKNLKIEAQKTNIALLDVESKVKNQLVLLGSISLLSLFFIITISKSRRNAKKEKIQQEIFSQDLLLSQEIERTRIARELHDSVGQQLTLIKIKSQKLNQDELTLLSNNALEEVRSISRNLYPALLKQLGLTKSIIQLINEYDEQTELFFSMDIDDIDTFFNETKSLNIYRLVQECLTNIVKHAKAKAVSVNIKIEDQRILTLISDNGKGFNVNDSKKKNSLGLKTIFERIRIMDGKISVDSELNKGTSFIFLIPLKDEQ
jgi:signal transduction histidine kinase